MDVFQLKINGSEICVPLTEPMIHLILIGYNNEFDICLNSTNGAQNNSWYKTSVEENGFSFSVSTSEQCDCSEPIEMKRKSDQEILEEFQSLTTLLTEKELL